MAMRAGDPRGMPNSRTVSLPAPIGGLNARDGIGEMPPTDAVKLENWFPTPSTVNLRNGNISWATGLGRNVETLAAYGGVTSNKLFAAANDSIFDVSTTGPVGAAVVTGQTSARWQSVNFGSTAANGQFLLLFNGADYPLSYDGTTWKTYGPTTAAQAISTITNAGTVATLTTAAPHVLLSGNWVTVSGATPAAYNGTFQITVVPATPAVAIASITRVGTTATLTTTVPHGLPLGTGTIITVSGATPSQYNGTYSVNVTGGSTLTYTMASDPGASASPVGSYVVEVNKFTYNMLSNPGGNATVVGTYTISPAISGVDPRKLVQATSFKQRIYAVEKDSSRCWYLGVNAIGGAASALDFGGMFKLGGYLMAVASWSVDNAAGLQEYFVAISSQGEVVVYQGYDPTNAATWSIAYHFRIGRPIGRRCFAKVGSDLIFLTADGAFPLSKALLTDRYQQRDAISEKIQNLINTDIQSYNANFGWQVIFYPIGDKVIVNVPYSDGAASYQYVMNTITGAWTKFTGWNSFCWEIYNDGLYFGAGGSVFQADIGYTDAGNAIACEALQAFNYFGVAGQKFFTMMRPILYGTIGLTPACSMNVDFDTTSAPQVTNTTVGGFTLWGSPWGSQWSSPNNTVRAWHGAGGIGYTGAPHIAMSVKNTVCQWQSTDVTYQLGGTL